MRSNRRLLIACILILVVDVGDRDALARTAIAVLSRDPSAVSAVRDELVRRRDRAAGPMFAAIDGIASYGWTLPVVRRLLMELSSAMSDEVETLSGPVA